MIQNCVVDVSQETIPTKIPNNDKYLRKRTQKELWYRSTATKTPLEQVTPILVKPLVNESIYVKHPEPQPIKAKGKGKAKSKASSKRKHPDTDVSNFVPALISTPASPPSPVRTRASKKKEVNVESTAPSSVPDQGSNTDTLGVKETYQTVREQGYEALGILTHKPSTSSIPIAESTLANSFYLVKLLAMRFHWSVPHLIHLNRNWLIMEDNSYSSNDIGVIDPHHGQ